MLRINLFSRFEIYAGDLAISGLDVRKGQELLAYLLLYRSRLHSREHLADLLWDDVAAKRSKKYLRQTLWQLQSVFTAFLPPEQNTILVTDAEFIGINPQFEYSLDIAQLERAYALAEDTQAGSLTRHQIALLEEAICVYRSDLLEGWYHDWCIFERARLRDIYLTILSKLMIACEIHQRYEAGLAYGNRILYYDRAHERTHRQMMRLHYLAGDRTAAIRQYYRCCDELESELEVKPTRYTQALYEQIKNDVLYEAALSPMAANEHLVLELSARFEQIQGLITTLLSSEAT